MKYNEGITLTSVVIYVIVMLIVVGTVGTITGFFYSSTQNLEKSANSLGEFNKFNTYFLNEVKLKGNAIERIDENRIVFTSGTTFALVDGALYKDMVKICTSVKACQFETYKQEEKTIIRVYLEVGNDFAKTIEYVMDYETIGSVGQYEENYTETENEETIDTIKKYDYIRTNLKMYYCWEKNTSTGFDSEATTWYDLTGNGYDGTATSTGYTWNNGLVCDGGTFRTGNLAAYKGTFEIQVNVPTSFTPYNSTQWWRCSCVFGLELGIGNIDGGIIIDKSGYYAIGYSGESIKSTDVLATDGVTHTVCMTYDGTTYLLYIDGVLKAEATYTVSGNVPQTYGIMWNNTETTSIVKGTVYNVRYYDRVLSQEEIDTNAKYNNQEING